MEAELAVRPQTADVCRDAHLVAALLGEEDAERLRAKAGAPALRVRRTYYDANERLLELSDSLHAAERFAYEMRLSRT